MTSARESVSGNSSRRRHLGRRSPRDPRGPTPLRVPHRRAVALQTNGNTIKNARLAMGGVAHKPWRLVKVEEWLAGKQLSKETFSAAATMAMEGAVTFGHNDFKIKMGKAAVTEALQQAAG